VPSRGAHDPFGDRADEYARIRPTYPAQLFAHLEGLTPRRDVAWDCGAGSGQTSRSLARSFARVLATDSSIRQLSRAAGHDRMQRIVAAAEAAPFRDHSVDLITVSAALHWFDRPRFYDEVRRVARPGAILAVWSYYVTQVHPAVDTVVMRFANEIVGTKWTPEFSVNREAYRGIDFPFERLPWPEFHAEKTMRLGDLLEFMRTWSAAQAWEREHGANPVDGIRDDLSRAWGDPETQRSVRWPLHGAIGRVGSESGGAAPPHGR
jgi:ubiquinone/menaquinone biosynthesis C-methylase UbiE